MINLGQTCVAPDYVLCSSKLQEKLVPMLKATLEEYFGKDPENSPDLCRIVSDRHYQRLVSMIQSTKSDITLGKNFYEKKSQCWTNIRKKVQFFCLNQCFLKLF